MSLLCLLSSRLSLFIPAASLWSAIFIFSTSSRCLRLIFFIFLAYLSSHILPIVASYSLCSLSESSSLIAQTLDSIQNLFSICLFFSHTPPVPKLLFLFLCLVVFFMFASSSPSLFSSSLLINIWLWVHWHDTTVPCWSWGCSDLAAEDEEGNTQHFQTFIWALFIWSQNLVVQFPEQPIADIFCSYYVKMSEVAARSCKYKHLSNKDFRIFGENIGWCRLGSDVFCRSY